MTDLSSLDPIALRRRRVLGIVVQEYTQSAQAIGSQTIARDYNLGVSAATIRNDLAVLEQEGYLTHLHTSSGRIPTAAGYRFFVQQLSARAAARELSPIEREGIRVELSRARGGVDQWLRVSTAALARTSHGAALATAPQSTRSRFKHLELVGIRDTKVLLVLVLQEGAIQQQVLDLDQPINQSALSAISNELNDRLGGLSSLEIRGRDELPGEDAEPQALLLRQMRLLAAELMESAEAPFDRPIYRDGLAQVLDAPEFAGGDNMHKIVNVFEQRSLLEQILAEYMWEDDVQVVINGEGRIRELQDISLVLSSYGNSEHATGILGVVGPVRMAYGRTIGAVRFVAALMSERMEDWYGE
ncbi:MAG: heat-inducible transcription repressor HrcA [Caldilineaceae bacterium]|nr:heat-inducible transcription repressor HrcA [Caldilineaceae bacterium]MCB9138767.1 heat-inducible transcription repressor HrcA [Caldilineaceae bacterium]